MGFRAPELLVIHLAQPGRGPRRALVLCYFVEGPALASLLAALGPDPCVIHDSDNPGGRFARLPGVGGVDTISSAAIAKAIAPGGEFAFTEIVLIGWSAGCQAVREQLEANAGGPLIGAAIALDGISGAWPGPSPAQIQPWQEFADRARAGDALFVLTHTQQTYTEHIPIGVQGGPFASTVTTAKLLFGDDAPGPGAEACDGSFYVVSSPSPTISAAAHVHQVREVLPDVVRRFLVPWLAGRDAANTENASAPEGIQTSVNKPTTNDPPDTDRAPPLSLGLRSLDVARGELGVAESPAGSNRGPRVDQYERPSGLVGLSWCEDFESWTRATAATPGEANPLGFHAAVHTLWEVASTLGLAHPPSWTPRPGDRAIFARAGQSPLHGGEGHVELVEIAPDGYGAWVGIGGNVDNAVTRTTHQAGEVVGWVEVPG